MPRIPVGVGFDVRDTVKGVVPDRICIVLVDRFKAGSQADPRQIDTRCGLTCRDPARVH